MDSKLDDLKSQIGSIVAQQGENSMLKAEIAEQGKQLKKLQGETQYLSKEVSAAKESLKCLICRSVARFPIVIMSCCSIILCEICFNTWNADNDSCIHCRSIVVDSGFTTIAMIRSLDMLMLKWRDEEDSSEVVIDD